MEHIEQLTRIETRAKQAGVSLGRLALEVGVYPHQLWRWRKGLTIPKVTTFADAMQRLNERLDEMEAARPRAPAD
jgi:hypothetical protein